MKLKSKKQIALWLNTLNLASDEFYIHDNLTVDILTNINLNNQKLTSLPVQFNHIKGNVDIQHNCLKTMKGLPKIIDGHFIFINNNLNLKNFDDFPEEINGILVFDFFNIEIFKKALTIKNLTQVNIVGEESTQLLKSFFNVSTTHNMYHTLEINELKQIMTIFHEKESLEQLINIKKHKNKIKL